ncbi:MAG: AAA family ATPase [bacterium]
MINLIESKEIQEIEQIKFTEQALLASILIDNRTIQHANILNITDFYDIKNREVFKIIKEKHKAGELIDLTTFAGTELQDYILNLIKMPEGLINCELYIKKIKEASYKRALKSRLNDILIKNNNFYEAKAEVIKLSKNLEKNVIQRFDFKAPSDIVAKKTSFLLEDFIPLPAGAVTMISSRGGSGKSALALQLALQAANREIKTLSWFSEDPDYTTKYRLQKIAEFTNIAINNNLKISDQIPFQILLKNNNKVSINSLFFEFKSACKDFTIIIIDPLIAFYGGNENDNGEARLFMDLLTEWAKQENKSIVLIHHQSKFATLGDARGATAFIDACRAHYTIEIDKQDDKCVKVKIEKDNWGIKQFFKEKTIQIFKNNYIQNNEVYYEKSVY